MMALESGAPPPTPVVPAPQRLTSRQAQVLAFIETFSCEHGYPPTLREIGAKLGISSTNGVTDHLHRLEKKGYIRRAELHSRGISLVSTESSHAVVDTAAVARMRIERVHRELVAVQTQVNRLVEIVAEMRGAS